MFYPSTTKKQGGDANSPIFAPLLLGGSSADGDENPSPTDDWLLAVLHTIPSLFFSYNILSSDLFWAQLYYAAWGGSYSSLRPLFYLSNAIMYIVFISVAVYSIVDPHASPEDYRTYALYILGIMYFFCAGGMFYYGSRVAAQLRPQSRDRSSSSQSYAARKMVLRRVTLLCAICSTVFCLRSAYCFVALFTCPGRSTMDIPQTLITAPLMPSFTS